MSATERRSDNPGTLRVAPFSAAAVALALRDEMRRRSRAADANGDPFPVNPTFQLFPAELQVAEDNVRVGSVVPEMTRYRGWTRVPARWVARCILFLAKVVTRPQSLFNFSILRSVRRLTLVAEQLARQQEQLRLAQEMFARLEERLTLRIAALEKSLTDTETPASLSRDPWGSAANQGEGPCDC